MYIYIKELKEDEEIEKNINMPKFLKKIIIKFIKIFNIITINKIDETHFLYIIPKVNNMNSIKKIINKNKSNKIFLSKDLKKYEKYVYQIENKKNIDLYVCEILEYIMEKIDRKLQLQNIYILVNTYNAQNISLITKLVNKVKTVNIVTQNISKYKILENKMYENDGTLITINNNKQKALKKANFIINLDADSKDIENYKINKESIIINCSNENIILKYFQGIIINNIKIKRDNNILYNEFDEIDIYNSFKKTEIEEIKIINLIGTNGIINSKEWENVQKNIDKY